MFNFVPYIVSSRIEKYPSIHHSAVASHPEHKLAVIGDSVSQGFQNGGVYRTDLSFPSFLARCFEPEPEFDLPLFTAQGGIPLNLEVLARGLSDEFGESLSWSEYLPALKHLYTTLTRIKNHWEGNRMSLAADQPTPYHNQSLWGFAMNDAWIVTEEMSREVIESEPESFSIFNFLPLHAMYITARLVLNPTLGEKFARHSQIDNIRYLQEHGGIENLIVCMGHNNVIGAVTDLRFEYSEEEDLDKRPYERGYTVYRPEHFRREFEQLAERVSQIGAQRVITQTIPYVTIPPVTRGVNEDPSRPHEGGYFDYYTRFWIWDSDFDPGRHPYLSKEEAIALDQSVDEYNQIIRETAERYGWIVVPLNRYVSAYARRRRGGPPKIKYPPDFREAMLRNPATRQLVDDRERPRLSTEYLRTDPETGNVNRGGIFSLDGIHPTTIGYGLIAHLYRQTMEREGVQFGRPLDWDRIIASDTLVTDPPAMLGELRSLLRFLSLGRNRKVSMLKEGLLDQLLSLFSPRRRGNFD